MAGGELAVVEDREMREQPLLISPCDRLSSEELSDTCRLGSVNDGLCRKRIEYHIVIVVTFISVTR